MNEFPTEEVERLNTDEPDQSARKSLFARLKLPLIAVAVLGAGAGGWWFFLGSPNPQSKVVEPQQEAVSKEAPAVGEIYQIGDIVINPADGRRHFMVSLSLEYTDPKAGEEIKKREPLLKDNLITFFSSQPVEVLTNIRYRQAIRARVKKILDYQLGEGVIKRVFFDKWVFQ